MQVFRFIAPILALALAGCSATAQDRSTGHVVDDAALTAKVKASLGQRHNLPRRGAALGVCRVRGSEARAENAANDVEGVRSVKNDLRVGR